MCRNFFCTNDGGYLLIPVNVPLRDVNLHQDEQVSGSSFLAVLVSCTQDAYLQVPVCWVLSCRARHLGLKQLLALNIVYFCYNAHPLPPCSAGNPACVGWQEIRL